MAITYDYESTVYVFVSCIDSSGVKPAVYGAGRKPGAPGSTISPERQGPAPAPNTIRAPPLAAYPPEMSSLALSDRSASASMCALLVHCSSRVQLVHFYYAITLVHVTMHTCF